MGDVTTEMLVGKLASESYNFCEWEISLLNFPSFVNVKTR